MRKSCLVVLLATLAACPDPDPDPRGGETPVSDALLSIVASMRAHGVQCAGAVWQEDDDFGPIAAWFQAAVDAGRVVIDVAALQACAEEVADYGCAETFWAWDEPACMEDVFYGATGTVAPGGGCEHDLECDGGFCDYTLGTCPGTCIAWAGDMEDCSALPCAPGFGCATLLVPAGEFCVAERIVAAGEPCGGLDVCMAGTSCEWDAEAGDDLCRAPVASGSPCDVTTTCQYPHFCFPDGVGTCRPLAARGEPCGASAGCNPSFDHCDPVEGRCAPRPGADEPCVAGVKCADGTFCDAADDTCRLLPVLGEPCASAGACAGEAFCDTALLEPVCAVTPGDGEDCSVSAYAKTVPPCAAGLFCQRDAAWAYTTCAPRVVADGICAGRADDECVDGTYCDAIGPTAGTCNPQKPPGAACADHWNECGAEAECWDGRCEVTSCW